MELDIKRDNLITMEDLIKLAISGQATILIGNPSRTIVLKNAVQAIAMETIARHLSGNTGWELANIRIYNGATLLATSAITRTFQAPNIVSVYALFLAASFTGSFTEVHLVDAAGNVFSKITGITGVSKANTEQLHITWDLTISI